MLYAVIMSERPFSQSFWGGVLVVVVGGLILWQLQTWLEVRRRAATSESRPDSELRASALRTEPLAVAAPAARRSTSRADAVDHPPLANSAASQTTASDGIDEVASSAEPEDRTNTVATPELRIPSPTREAAPPDGVYKGTVVRCQTEDSAEPGTRSPICFNVGGVVYAVPASDLRMLYHGWYKQKVYMLAVDDVIRAEVRMGEFAKVELLNSATQRD